MPPPFRADQIGSLIRPQYLHDALDAISSEMRMHNVDYSTADPDLVRKVREAEKQAIAEAVSQQVKRGITPISSGEFQRASFVSGFFDGLDGMEIQFKHVDEFRSGHPITRPYIQLGIPGRDQPVATGKVKFRQSAYLHEFEYVKSLLPEYLWGEVKITIPSPSWSQSQLKDGKAFTEEAYTNVDDYLKDVSEAMRQEILALYNAGVRFIQIDDPMFAMMVDDEYLEIQKAEGMDLDALLDPSIKAHNMVIRDLPPDLTIAFHLCRGNIPKGMKAAVGGYHKLAARMFQGLDYTRFALEWDNEMVTGNFTPLQHLPADKIAVLGLVTTKIADLEDINELKTQVFEAADVIAKAHGNSREQALMNLAVSPSCGFSSVSKSVGTRMDEGIQWQKLELIKKLSEEIWGSPSKV